MQLRQKKFLMRCIDTKSEVSVVFIYGSFDKLRFVYSILKNH